MSLKTTLQTLVYAAPKANVQELAELREQLRLVYGAKFIKTADTDLANVHETIRENINIISMPTGLKVERLVRLASEEGVDYKPSDKSRAVFLLLFTLAGV